MDNVTLNIEGGLPENSELLSRGGGVYTFRWNLQMPTARSLVFIAIDSRGAASTFAPRVEICACVNEGVCTANGLLSANSTLLLNCQCTEGNEDFSIACLLA